MLQKIKTVPWLYYLKELRDVRLLGLLVFGIIVLLVSYSGLGIIQTNYALQQQVSRLQQQNKVQDLENANQKLRNEYLKTDTYLELTARKQFGKAAPGETLVLIPNTVALEHTVAPLPDTTAPQSSAQPTKPSYQRNFEAWMDFFLHRQ